MPTRIPLRTIENALAEAGLLVERRGALPADVDGVTDDSRAVARGGLFVAVRGADRDGHDFLDGAAQRGAAAAIVEDASRTRLPSLVVRNGRRAAAVAASAAFDFPATQLQAVGVTGTNGKTTTVNMLRHLLSEPETAGATSAPAASIGTLGVLVGSKGEPLDGGQGLTTPGPVELQRVFRALVDQGVSRVAMEVSSHALDQHRVEGVQFDAAVFTNLTRDHLDYHRTMDAYFAAKARLIGLLRSGGAAVVNMDDDAWTSLPVAARIITFGTSVGAYVRCEEVRYRARGSEWTLVIGEERHAIALPLIGDFNVMNALGAAAGAWALGLSGARIAAALSTMPQVPGRLEVVHARPAVLRDYAHTPDALARALDAVRPFVGAGRLIVVFGCGGDRDRGKRPEMGAIAASRADVAIVTSDNPRTEDPEAIIDEIEAGMGGVRHERIEDRRSAIARALELANADDVIVLAGKGHETYQIRGTAKLPFDEKLVVAELTTPALTRGAAR
jgi:UDP-N-acetylmuramoyl-L-alanyl-D-glutamate--2,6-diaminopimelate ligase